MVVDDQHVLALALAERLSLDGFQVEVAGSAAEALATFDRAPCDLAFIDLKLPDGSGIELAGQLKRLRPQIRVILITGFAATFDDPGVRSRDVDVVLPKPWTPRELESVLGRVKNGEW